MHEMKNKDKERLCTLKNAKPEMAFKARQRNPTSYNMAFVVFIECKQKFITFPVAVVSVVAQVQPNESSQLLRRYASVSFIAYHLGFVCEPRGRRTYFLVLLAR